MDITLAGAAVAGLVGSLHCVGMCGPLVCSACGIDERGARPRLLLFLLGKTVTYASLGALAGGLHRWLDRDFGRSAWVAGSLGLIAGVVTIVLGATALWRAGGGTPALVNLGGTGKRPLKWASTGLGALAGLLPCGLVYAMLAHALTSHSPLHGAALMACFGLGTVPALAAAGELGRWARRHLGKRAPAVANWTIILVGLATLIRAGVGLYAASSGNGCSFH